MELPLELRAEIERRAETLSPARMKEISRALTARYRTESGRGRVLLSTEAEAAVYAAVRMPATYGAMSAALAAALAQSSLHPQTLLDVGAGTGTAGWAAAAQLTLSQVTCLEREGAMRALGQSLMREGPEVLRTACWQAADLTGSATLPRAQLVTASYVLNELAPAQRTAALSRLWDAAEQMLLIVEPGTPEGAAQLRAARTALLQRGAYLAAPCPHEGACPVQGEDWCHFSCRVPRSRLHKMLKDGDAPFEDEKFAYLAFMREPCGSRGARVRRHPQIEKGRITLELCTAEGLEKRTVTKKEGAAFKAARKADCGDVFAPGQSAEENY